MIFYRTAIIDVEAERKRIAKVRYNKAETKVLLRLCDILEQKGVEDAAQFLCKHRNMVEFVGRDVFVILRDRARNGQQWFTRKQLEEAWAKRDKQGKVS